MFGIERQQFAAAILERGQQQRAGHHDRFLVREQQAFAGARGGECRLEPGRADDCRDHGVAMRAGCGFDQRCGAGCDAAADAGGAEPRAQIRLASRVGDHRQFGAETHAQRGQRVDAAMRR